MPINPLAKPANHADVLLDEESQDAQAKRGYATPYYGVDQMTSTGKPFDYNAAYNTKEEPDYIKTERERILKGLGVPSAAAVKATGLDPASALAIGAAGGVSAAPVSPIASGYQSRVTSGIQELFGGGPTITVAGGNTPTTTPGALPNLENMNTFERQRYAELARTSGEIPTAEAASSYENLGELGRQRFQEFIKEATPGSPRRYKNQSPVY